MIKLLHLEITDTCEGCPYLDKEWFYCTAYQMEIKTSRLFIFPKIPIWCPLPTYEEGGKF